MSGQRLVRRIQTFRRSVLRSLYKCQKQISLFSQTITAKTLNTFSVFFLFYCVWNINDDDDYGSSHIHTHTRKKILSTFTFVNYVNDNFVCKCLSDALPYTFFRVYRCHTKTHATLILYINYNVFYLVNSQQLLKIFLYIFFSSQFNS